MRFGIALGLLASGQALAQDVDNVDQGTTFPTIAAAVAAADPGDTLSLVAPSFRESVAIDRDVTIEGNGATTLSSPGGPVFVLAAGVELVLSDVVVAPSGGDGVLRGISATAGGNVVRVVDSTFTTGDATSDGSALEIVDPVRVVVTRTSFGPITVGADAADIGGAISVTAATPAPVTLTDATFTDLETARGGGAISVVGADLVCTRCSFTRTEGRSGAAIEASGGTVLVEQSLFCDTRTRSASLSGAISAGDAVVTVRASRFVETDAQAGAGALVGLAGSDWTVENNTFVATGGASAVDVSASDRATLRNNLFSDGEGFAVVPGPQFDVRYGWFHDNAGGDVSGEVLGPTNRTGEPELVSFTANGDCGDDQLWPTATSGLLDAGDPAILDPDGSRSDIGAYGGPAADPALHEDGDGDGYPFLLDCDDGRAGVSPGAVEDCDTVDDDCDGLIDDDDPDVVGQELYFADCDQDGQAAGGSFASCFDPADPPACGGVWLSLSDLGPGAPADCDDDDDTIYVGADERCEPGDQDCDGDDDAGAVDANLWYVDADRDGYGSDTREPVCGETPPDGYADGFGDCDDENPRAFPGARDDCGDHVDQDCNGGDGNDVTIRDWYPDGDGDGYGATDVLPTLDCTYDLDGFATNREDCDDGDGGVNPGATEVCNGKDDDCARGIDDGIDLCVVDPVPKPPAPIRPAGACSTGPAGPGWLSIAALLLLRRRSR